MHTTSLFYLSLMMLSNDTGPKKQDPEEAKDGNSDLQEPNTSETQVALRNSYIIRSSVGKMEILLIFAIPFI